MRASGLRRDRRSGLVKHELELFSTFASECDEDFVVVFVPLSSI